MQSIRAHEHVYSHIFYHVYIKKAHIICAIRRYCKPSDSHYYSILIWLFLDEETVPPAGAGHGGQPEAGGVHPAQPAVRARARAARRRALAAPRPNAGTP